MNRPVAVKVVPGFTVRNRLPETGPVAVKVVSGFTVRNRLPETEPVAVKVVSGFTVRNRLPEMQNPMCRRVQSPHLVILTGAGISACSGVDTFRDPDGIWSKHDMEEVCTPQGYARNPALVHGFYNGRRADLPRVFPNAAHKALVRLEAVVSATGGSFFLVTQNVDDLHDRAGSENLLHMHGALMRACCTACSRSFNWHQDITVDSVCPSCGRARVVRPDIVWFGEMPKGMDRIEQAMGQATHFVSIGTSGNVYPAAGLVAVARERGIRATELNLEPSENAHFFTDALYGKASDAVPRWVDDFVTSLEMDHGQKIDG